jgi:hypothetical protein
MPIGRTNTVQIVATDDGFAVLETVGNRIVLLDCAGVPTGGVAPLADARASTTYNTGRHWMTWGGGLVFGYGFDDAVGVTHVGDGAARPALDLGDASVRGVTVCGAGCFAASVDLPNDFIAIARFRDTGELFEPLRSYWSANLNGELAWTGALLLVASPSPEASALESPARGIFVADENGTVYADEFRRPTSVELHVRPTSTGATFGIGGVAPTGPTSFAALGVYPRDKVYFGRWACAP